MCGYGNRVPHGWHHISDETIVVGTGKLPPLIWTPVDDGPPPYPERDADDAMLKAIAAKQDDPWPNGMS